VPADDETADHVVKDRVTDDDAGIDADNEAPSDSDAADKDAPSSTVPANGGSAAPSGGGIWRS